MKEHQPSLFDSPMVRSGDPGTSHAAAAVIRGELGKIQRAVLEAYECHGEMSARRAERLPEFASYGFSTIRKRISELHQAGFLVECGLDHGGRSPATVYRLKGERCA